MSSVPNWPYIVAKSCGGEGKHQDVTISLWPLLQQSASHHAAAQAALAQSYCSDCAIDGADMHLSPAFSMWCSCILYLLRLVQYVFMHECLLSC